MNNTITREDLKAGLRMLAAVSEAIRDLGTVPAGTIYAQLMGKIDEPGFERLIGVLVNAGLVKRDQSHLLHWTGPKA